MTTRFIKSNYQPIPIVPSEPCPSVSHLPWEYLRLLRSHPAHLFRVQLHWVIAQFCFSCCLQVVTSHWEVTVSLHPPGQDNENVCIEASPHLQKGLRRANRILIVSLPMHLNPDQALLLCSHLHHYHSYLSDLKANKRRHHQDSKVSQPPSEH